VFPGIDVGTPSVTCAPLAGMSVEEKVGQMIQADR
jgi:hypothetical protein